ncbi:MAG: PQQ-binding-like beta-propeller repeat protein [Planctomycetota bacterium]|nr:PQQ-binding-like beta-propeller repeat protein [Planctomycetota bacterium]
MTLVHTVYSATLLALSATAVAQGDIPAWGNWRGPDHNAIAKTGNPPTEWSEEDGKNILWQIDLPGKGSSSPIICGDRVFVTTAIETDETGKPAESPPNQGSGDERQRDSSGRDTGRRSRRFGRSRRGGFGGGRTPTKVHNFSVLAFDRQTGKQVWRTKVHSTVPHAGSHRTGSQASNSPLTDGEHIFAHFGSRGIHCLDMDGKLKWSKQLGNMTTRNSFGEGSSPALHGNTLVVNWDHEAGSFVLALNKKTGKELWRTKRDERTSWSTPLIVEANGKTQVIIAATNASRSYDLKNGKMIWSLEGLTANVIPTPIYQNGLLYLMSGYRGNAVQVLNLKGAKGDLADSKKIVWTHDRNTSYTPSGLVYDGNFYFMRSNNGILSCLDAKTGKVRYEGERLGIRSVYSSPVAAAGRVYITGREGTTKVVEAGDTFKELATNKLDDTIDASAAVVGDKLYLRGWKKLYCIADTSKDK